MMFVEEVEANPEINCKKIYPSFGIPPTYIALFHLVLNLTDLLIAKINKTDLNFEIHILSDLLIVPIRVGVLVDSMLKVFLLLVILILRDTSGQPSFYEPAENLAVHKRNVITDSESPEIRLLHIIEVRKVESHVLRKRQTGAI